MSNNLSATFYLNKKERLQKTFHEKYQKLCEEEKEKM